MARYRNHYISGRKITASKGSNWDPKDIVAFVKVLKAKDPTMVVPLYETNFRDALRAALDAAGMRWRIVDADELERERAQRRAEQKRFAAKQRDEWRRSGSVT